MACNYPYFYNKIAKVEPDKKAYTFYNSEMSVMARKMM